MVNLYRQFKETEIMENDLMGEFYGEHMSAMTAEGLLGKGEIAEELAFRDWQIAELKAKNKAYKAALLKARSLNSRYCIHETIDKALKGDSNECN